MGRGNRRSLGTDGIVLAAEQFAASILEDGHATRTLHGLNGFPTRNTNLSDGCFPTWAKRLCVRACRIGARMDATVGFADGAQAGSFASFAHGGDYGGEDDGNGEEKRC